MSVRPSLHVCPSVCMEQLGSRCKDFPEILYLIIFRKYVDKIQVSLKSGMNNGALYVKAYVYL
jgi:hypothetical protein